MNVKTLAPLALALISAGVASADAGRLIDPTGQLATVPIDVPGDVHSALLAAGIIPDPYVGTNEVLTAWVGDHDWIVEWDFDLTREELAKRRLALRLEDVDTLCDLSLNGVSLGSTRNRFRRYEFDIAGTARIGRNTLRGFFRNVVAAKEAAAKTYDRTYWVHGPLLQNLNLIRKPFCHGGWDWGPRILGVGFMKRPEVIATNGLTVDYVHCDTDFDADYSRATVNVNVEFTRADGSKGATRVQKIVERPRLWWPRGLGEQAFTEVTVEVEGTLVTRRLGLRKVELVTEPDAFGTSCYFRVNGRRLFAKGTDFIPCDALESRQTPARYANLLQSALDANMNMVRVWGGGQYERDFFYDWCDANGLLVWQDCMFACACYPGTSAFLDEIDREVRHQVKRLKDHPSIALWCGDNECAVGHAVWYGKSIRTPEDDASPAALVRVKAAAAEQLARYAADHDLARAWNLKESGGTVTLHRIAVVFHGGDVALCEEI